MPEVTLRQQVNSRVAARLRTDRSNRRNHPKFVMRGHRGTRVVFPFGPLPVDHSGAGPLWVVLSRGAGREPYLAEGDGQLPVMAFTLTLARKHRAEVVTDLIDGLTALANRGERVVVTYGQPEDGVWRITELSISVTARRFGSNAPTRAEASVTLTRVEASESGVGPGHNDGGGKSKAAGPRVHVVKRGDTLWSLARRYYDDGSKWARIGDANKITRPHRDLTPGRRLRIPRIG